MEVTLLTLVSWSALTASVLLYVTGGATCLYIINKKTVGNVQLFPFIATCFSSTIWLKYGILTNNTTIKIVNATGSILQVIYICVYHIHAREKRKINITLLLSVIPLYGALFYAKYIAASDAIAANHLGLLGVFLSIVMIASPLVTLKEIIRTKSVATMSFSFVLICFISCVLWTVFGMMIKDIFVVIPNGAGVLLGIFQLFLFLIYPSKKPDIDLNGFAKDVLET